MLNITVELLEHYLRATDAQYDRATLAALIAKDGIEEAAFMYLEIGGIFRLGLCAAAEESEHFRLRWVDEKSLSEPVRYAVESSCRTMRDYYLECAGISADAWESARKR